MSPYMKPPPFMIGLSFLAWGVMTGNLDLAVLFAVIAECHVFIKSRWEIDENSFAKLWDTVALVYLSTAIIMLIRLGGTQMVYSLIKWTPVMLLPLLLAQRLAAADTVALHSFSAIGKMLHSPVNRYYGQTRKREIHVNLEYPFLCTILIGSAMERSEGVWFYVFICVVVGWALLRSPTGRRRNRVIWCVLFLFSAGLGYAGQLGIRALHRKIERSFLGMFAQSHIPSGPDQVGYTSIGRVGRVQQSSSVLWRLIPDKGVPPDYLKAITYNSYKRGMWTNTRMDGLREYKAADRVRMDGQDHWFLSGPTNGVVSTKYSLIGRGAGRAESLLQNEASGTYSYFVLSDDASALVGLDAGEVQLNPLSTVRAIDAGDFIRFQVHSRDGASRDMAPTRRDLTIPFKEREATVRISNQLNLKSLDARQAAEAIEQFFDNGFTYSTYLTIRDDLEGENGSALSRFLEEVRKGHCEYYAAGTVMLLRAAGVPARYVVGYSVSEFDTKQEAYLIRGLHGHAWAQAWIDDQWVIVDNTPEGWEDIERAGIPRLQALRDRIEEWRLQLGLWQQSPEGVRAMGLLTWVGIPLILFALFYRVLRGDQNLKRVRMSDGRTDTSWSQGRDSEFYDVEAALKNVLGQRPAGTPVAAWYRTETNCLPPDAARFVPELISLHYAYRFDATPMPDDRRQRLRELSDACLSALSETTSDES